MSSFEQSIKSQYAKVFLQNDWRSFKKVAEFYLKRAATLKMKDFSDVDRVFQLLIRNIQKRLFLGIGCELMVKACYLKNGYAINKSNATNSKIIDLSTVQPGQLEANDTFTLGNLIDNIQRVQNFTDIIALKRGLTILRIFRNKEGHVTVFRHAYDAQNYRDIEASIIIFYSEVFKEKLDFSIGMGRNEKGKFKIVS